MRGCRHARWVEESGTSGLVETGRLDRVVKSLKDPTHQRPQIVAFVGQGEKRRALNYLFPSRPQVDYLRTRGSVAAEQGSSQVFADLHVDVSRADQDDPLLFVDCCPGAPVPVHDSPETCHETKFIRATSPILSHVAPDALMTRLLLPFLDVVCIFADDIGTLADVLSYLMRWSEYEVASTLPLKVRPRVRVVTFKPLTKETLSEQTAFKRNLRLLRGRHFSTVQFVRLSVWSRPKPSSRYSELGRLVFQDDLDIARRCRRIYRTSFSATHLSWFFSRAISHVVGASQHPFDFIGASRLPRPLPPHYPSQLSIFIGLALQHHFSHDSIVGLIASSIVYDAYPSSAHVFAPGPLFSKLYRNAVGQALEETYIPFVADARAQQRPVSTIRVLDQIQTRVCQWVGKEAGKEGWARKLHLTNLRSFQSPADWVKVKSNLCCLFCLVNRPQHVMPCKHAICDSCVQNFGAPQVGVEYSYRVKDCPLRCPHTGDHLHAILKPPTAGIRMLSIDGGGPRGVVALEFLRLLECKMGSGLQIQDYFDVGVGTSAGALLVLAMLRMGWNVAHCIEVFCVFANNVFDGQAERQLTLRGSMRSYVSSFIGCLFSEGLYSAETVAVLLRECLGSTTRLFDFPVEGVSRWKFLVTATTVGNASTVVFCNYNLPLDRTESVPGQGPECAAATYRHCERSTPEAEPYLWQVAGATSAAPPFFHPVTVGQYGKYQDGGLRNPNPTKIAIEESENLWVSRPRRDLIVSIGTGLPPRTIKPLDSSRSTIFKNLVVFRMARWLRVRLEECLDAEMVHQELLRVLNPVDTPFVDRYHRLNVEIPGGLPRLDDASSMQSLMQDVRQTDSETQLLDIKLALIASSFFFELDALPTYGPGGQYTCRGAVRIRGDASAVFKLIGDEYLGCAQFIKNDNVLADVTGDDIDPVCTTCERYSRRITFLTPLLTDQVTLSLRLGRLGKHRMSGLPQSMQWFIVQQKLNDPFSPFRPPADVCGCRTSTTVERPATQGRMGSKRPWTPACDSRRRRRMRTRSMRTRSMTKRMRR